MKTLIFIQHFNNIILRENNMKKIVNEILKISNRIYKELGSGFPENIYQNALAIELRRAKIEYLKEVNIEIFYRNESIGADRPDFILLPCKGKPFSIKSPIVIEMKITNKLTDDNKQQLKSYFSSFPKNNSPSLKDITHGILLKFPKVEESVAAKDEPRIVEVELYEYNLKTKKMSAIEL